MRPLDQNRERPITLTNHKINEMFLESPKKAGSIEVICGSMFSGKTEELIRRMKRAQFAKQKVEIYKPCIDVRYSEDQVVSHDAHSIPSTPIESPASMLLLSSDVEVVGIDEAQFFDETLVEVVQTLANRGIRVIIAGLDTDFLGKPFGPMPALMAVAEDIQKVHAICVRCGSPANHSHRLTSSDQLVVALTSRQRRLRTDCHVCRDKRYSHIRRGNAYPP